MKPHLFSPVAALAAALCLAAGCIAPTSRLHYDPAGQDAVKIAVILPLSGSNQAYGRRILDGVALAADELNNGPGIDGRTVELLTYDTQSNPDTAVERVREAVRDGAVAAVAGYNSTELDAMDGVLRRRRLPAITPMATIDGLTEQNPFLFRSSFTDSQQGHALAAYAWYWRKLLRLGVIMNMEPDDEYSRSVARETAQAFKDLGGTVVRTVEFSGESRDLVPTLRSLLTAGPQAIVVPTETAMAAAIVKELRALGYQGLLLGPDSWDEESFMRNCGDRPGDCAYIAFYNEKNKTREYRLFHDSFREKYSHEPGSCEAQGYDSLKLLAIGLGNARSIEEFTSNLLTVRGYPGAAASYTFLPPAAELDRTMYINTIRPAGRNNPLPHGTNSRSFPYSKLATYNN